MATFLLKTPRLYLRKYISEDYPLLIQLYTNWKWEGIDEAFAKQFLETVIQKQYEKGGGVFATFLKENDVYIGH
jgi:RimJ/RimL family protein N-acetyltransferase